MSVNISIGKWLLDWLGKGRFIYCCTLALYVKSDSCYSRFKLVLSTLISFSFSLKVVRVFGLFPAKF